MIQSNNVSSLVKKKRQKKLISSDSLLRTFVVTALLTPLSRYVLIYFFAAIFSFNLAAISSSQSQALQVFRK